MFSARRQLDDLTVSSKSSIGLRRIGSILESINTSPVLPLLGTLRDTNTDICSQKYSKAFVTAASGSIVPFVFTNTSKVSLSPLSKPQKQLF